ncbi:MAG: type II toxin-antitoxin system VapC family toxin [Byssovorax sp.]
MTPRYLLDTNVLSESMRPAPDPDVLRRLVEVGDAAATGAPVWHELEYGRSRLPAGRRRRAIDAVMDRLEAVLVILPYDGAAARWHARERARLTKKGKPPPFVDGQIAAIAAVSGLVLVTRNVRDFVPFTDLRVESWFDAE